MRECHAVRSASLQSPLRLFLSPSIRSAFSLPPPRLFSTASIRPDLSVPPCRPLLTQSPRRVRSTPLKTYARADFSTGAMGNRAAEWRVVVTRRLPPAAMDALVAATELKLDVWDSEDAIPPAELIARVPGADAIYCVLTDRIDASVLDAAGPNLKCVSTMSVGHNHIDVPECRKRGILVGNTPDVLTETTADTCVGLVLAACRRFKEAAAAVENGSWGTWAPMWMCGPDVHSSVVGIVGLGRIGAAVAKRLKAFNCRILYSGRSPKPDLAGPVGAEFVPLATLLSQADIVIPLCPLSDETRGMFDETKFNLMKSSAVFINAARGELVNQDHLVTALMEKQIFGAGLDVTTPEPLPLDSPLIKCPNCFILPHIGSASDGTRTAMAMLAVRNLLAANKGESIPCEVK